jgi:hypothetical protein
MTIRVCPVVAEWFGPSISDQLIKPVLPDSRTPLG